MDPLADAGHQPRGLDIGTTTAKNVGIGPLCAHPIPRLRGSSSSELGEKSGAASLSIHRLATRLGLAQPGGFDIRPGAGGEYPFNLEPDCALRYTSVALTAWER